MATRTYNTGRVVGWSAYEEFLKEHPTVDPAVVTEQIYTTATTFGVTRIVKVPLTNWTGTNVLTKTISVPGAVWGVIPIAGVYYDGLSALADTAKAATAKENAQKAASNIFACYCSDAQGNKLTSSTSMSGYLTFCAHPSVVASGLTELPLIVRGLGLEGLSDGHAYLGPEGLVDNLGEDKETGQLITEHILTTFRLPGDDGVYAQWFGIKFQTGQRWIAGLSFMDSDYETQHPSEIFPRMQNITGSQTDTTTGANSVPIQLSSIPTSLSSNSQQYAGYFNWADLIRMLYTDQKARLNFEVKKYDSKNITYIDITQLFGTKVWDPSSQQYITQPAILPFKLGLGDQVAYQVLEPWRRDQTVPTAGNYDGLYRVVLRLYPSSTSVVSRFDMVILSYLKSDVTLTTTQSNPDRGHGFWWRGKVPDDCYNAVQARYPVPSLTRERMTLIGNTIGSLSGNFQASDAQPVCWDTAPETTDVNYGPVDYLLRKSLTLTQNSNLWQVNFTIKGAGVSGSNNDRVYGIDTSCLHGAVDSNSSLSTYLVSTNSGSSYTWPAATTMDPLIEDFDISHASFSEFLSGTYRTI